MRSSSISREIQPAGGEDHEVLSTPNEDHGNYSWLREMESLEKLITAEKKFIETLPKMIDRNNTDMDELLSAFQQLKADGKGGVAKLRKMKKQVMYWRERVFVTPNTDPNFMIIQNNGFHDDNHRFDMSPEMFQKSSIFRDYERRYHELGTELKQCLLCLAAFPENAKIKRRVLVQWWIGEGFVPPPPSVVWEDHDISTIHEPNHRTAEDWGDLYFHQLISRGFLEPDKKGIGTDVNTCRMHPSIYSVIVKLAADRKFFDIDLKEWSVKQNHWSSLRSCLKVGKGLTDLQDLKKLNTLFNIDETLLTLNPDWFSEMKNARVLHLGSWQGTATHQIEVLTKRSMKKRKYVNALDGLENVKQLRLLNLERFSRIRKLPRSISNLTDLTILNLRACHHLEFLPDGIGCLENLTHLDMSDCYLLEHMPKGIARLAKIQVLKGFVVRCIAHLGDTNYNTCTLTDLRRCTKLRKLGLHIRQAGFPSENDLSSLNSLRALIKLKIAWGSTHDPLTPLEKQCRPVTRPLLPLNSLLPPQLMKLELVCLPFTSLPFWLLPYNLPSLKKLCVTGGNLSEIPELMLWKIEELHLKYMKNLEIEWVYFRGHFKELKYLKTVNCPKLSFFPCDGNGVWIP